MELTLLPVPLYKKILEQVPLLVLWRIELIILLAPLKMTTFKPVSIVLLEPLLTGLELHVLIPQRWHITTQVTTNEQGSRHRLFVHCALQSKL